MNDDLILFGTGLDLTTPDEDDFWLDRVDEILERAFHDQDAEYALNACVNLIQVAKISGKALAKMLYSLKAHWSQFEILDSFEEYVYPKLGLSAGTIERYIRIEQMLRELPSEASNLRERPIQQLIPIANAVAQGNEFSTEEWRRIAQAPTEHDIKTELRNITGQEPRRSGVNIVLQRDGELWAYNTEERVYLGSLDLSSTNPLVTKAINRITDRSGVIRQ